MLLILGIFPFRLALPSFVVATDAADTFESVLFDVRLSADTRPRREDDFFRLAERLDDDLLLELEGCSADVEAVARLEESK